MTQTDFAGVLKRIADYAATITVRSAGDSLVGMYRNIGNRGPRAIPFRASRGRWPEGPARPALLGRWDATFITEQQAESSDPRGWPDNRCSHARPSRMAIRARSSLYTAASQP